MLHGMENSDFLKQIGKRIRYIRKEKGLTQERLAELTGLHPTSISEIERGKVNGFICNYFNLAAVLNVSLADLVEPSTDLGDGRFWDEIRTLLAMVKTLDEKKRAVYLDSALKLFERVNSI